MGTSDKNMGHTQRIATRQSKQGKSLRGYIRMQYRIILIHEHFQIYYVLRGTLYLYGKT